MAIRATDRGQLGHVTGLADGVPVSMEFQGRLLDPTGEGWRRDRDRDENGREPRRGKVQETNSNKKSWTRQSIADAATSLPPPPSPITHSQTLLRLIRVEPTGQGTDCQLSLFQGSLSPAGPSSSNSRSDYMM